MKKRFFISLISALLCTLLSLSTAAAAFKDVTGKEYYANAAETLYYMGVLSGYENGTFGAELPITRAEAATMLCRATVLGEYASLGNEYTLFDDMGPWHWANGYVNILCSFEILNGYEDGTFRPENNILYEEAVKLLVSTETGALESTDGNWASPYLDYAEQKNYTAGLVGQVGTPITRGDMALLFYNIMVTEDSSPESGQDETLPSSPNDNDEPTPETQSSALCIGDNAYTIGMTVEALTAAAGHPDEKLPSTTGLTWYVFGTDTYESFFLAGVSDDRVLALCSNAKNASCDGAAIGATSFSFTQTENAMVTGYTDKNDNGILHMLYLASPDIPAASAPSAEQLAGESKANFHLVNAFRVFHGESSLKWNEKAATAARLHSEDMAAKNYFSHDSLDGRSFSERLKAQNITLSRGAGENIGAGYRTAVLAHNGWVNSTGHRSNILASHYKELGVGGGYHAQADYRSYFTQDFIG